MVHEKRDDATDTTNMEVTPLQFKIEQYNWGCKLTLKNDQYPGFYLLWIDEVLVTDLP